MADDDSDIDSYDDDAQANDRGLMTEEKARLQRRKGRGGVFRNVQRGNSLAFARGQREIRI